MKVKAVEVAFQHLKAELLTLGINEHHYLSPQLAALDQAIQALQPVPVVAWICKDCLFRCLRENTCDNAEAINPLHPQSCPSACEMYVPCGNEPVPVGGEE